MVRGKGAKEKAVSPRRPAIVPLDGMGSPLYGQAITKYGGQQFVAAPALDLLIKTLDYALAACLLKNSEKAMCSLALLVEGLDYRKVPDLAHRFADLYRYCQALVREERFDQTGILLLGLRDAWLEVKGQKVNHRVFLPR
jgi:hypothetical protein